MFPLLSNMIGGSLGYIISQPDKDRELQQKQQALQEFLSLHPEMNSVDFQRYAQQGTYNPLLEQTFQQNPSQMNNIQVNPAYQSAAQQALQEMQQIGHSGGMRVQDQADLNNMMNQIAAQNQGQRAAIQQSFAQRGMGGSGFDLASQMLNQQAGANQANQNGTQIAAQAQNRALQSLMGAGSLGSQLNSQEFNQRAQTAAAQDMINRFNTQNQQQVADTNTSAQNQAQLTNLSERQRLANMNTDLTNKQQMQNNDYRQQYYNDMLSRAQGAAGQYLNTANQYGQNAADTSRMFSGMGQAGGDAYSQAQSDQKWQGYLDAKQNKDILDAAD